MPESGNINGWEAHKYVGNITGKWLLPSYTIGIGYLRG